MNLSSLKKTLLVCGVVMLLIAIWANVNLYVSLASNPVDKFTWASLGLVFDIVKITMLIISGVLWSVFHRPFAAVLSFLTWVLLTGLSLSTLFGYTSKVTAESERKAVVEGMDYKQAQASLDATNKRLEGLASYASIDSSSLQSQLDSLNAKKAQAESDLTACPRNYMTNCVKPAKAKLAQVEAQIAPLQAQLLGYREYQGLNRLKEQSLTASKTALAGGASIESLHPMFLNGSTLFHDVFDVNVSGYQLKVLFLAISAVLCELLASFTLFLVAALGGKNFHAVEVSSVEAMPNKSMTSDHTLESMTLGNDSKPMAKQVNDSSEGKKKVGTIYHCESCGAEYSARTVWQKYCPTCSSERKRGVLLARSRLVNKQG
jgi:hypothetical protein